MKNSDSFNMNQQQPGEEKRTVLKKNRKLVLALKMLLFLSLTLLLIHFSGEWLYPTTGRTYRAIKRLTSVSASPDVMALGSSTCFCSFIPTRFQEKTNQTALMTATSTQQMAESKALLQQAVDQGTFPKTVFLYAGPPERFQTSNTQYAVQVIENLPYGLNRFRLIWELPYTTEELPDVLFKAYRSREFYPTRIAELKSLLTHQNETEEQPTEDTVDDGYVYRGESRYQEGSVLITDRLMYSEGQAVSENVLQQLREIAAMCSENNAKLIIIFPPRLRINILTMNKSEEGIYGKYHDEVQAVADQLHCEFWDLNYVRPEYMTIGADMFVDSHHGNYKLATAVTDFLAEIYLEYMEGTFDRSKYFMQDWDEFKSTYPEVQGIYFEKVGDYMSFRPLYFGVSEDVPVEWRASIADQRDGSYTLYQDWTQERQFPKTEEYQKGRYLRFEVRRVGNSQVDQDVIYKIQ